MPQKLSPAGLPPVARQLHFGCILPRGDLVDPGGRPPTCICHSDLEMPGCGLAGGPGPRVEEPVPTSWDVLPIVSGSQGRGNPASGALGPERIGGRSRGIPGGEAGRTDSPTRIPATAP